MKRPPGKTATMESFVNLPRGLFMTVMWPTADALPRQA